MYCTCTADITLYNAALQHSYAHGIMSFGRHGVCISGPLVLHEKCCAPVQLVTVEAPMRMHAGYALLS